MIVHSIRWQLQIWHGLILLLVLAGFGFTAHRLQRANELRRVDQELQGRLGPIMEALRRPLPGQGRPGGPRRLDGNPDNWGSGPPFRGPGGESPPMNREFRLGLGRPGLFDDATNGFYYVVWTRDGRELSRSGAAPAELSRPDRPRVSARQPASHSRGSMRELHTFTRRGECVVVGRSIATELGNLRQLALWLSGLGGAVLVLGLLGGWWLATRAIRPIAEISSAATRIAGGDLSHRISTADTANELGQLAGILNSTFSRLESAFARQQQFTADASHELRTPIAVILSQTQATLARERDAEDYRETLETCQRAAQRMRRLTESLLELARMDAGQIQLKMEPCDLSRVAQGCIGLIRPLAAGRGITLQTELQPAECAGDAERLAQVITNLLANAVDYNKPEGEVRLATRQENGSVVLTVADTGPGIPPEDLPHLFERFYRADQARTTTSGHSGLGLAICKAIVEAHGGEISVSSIGGAGSTFVVRLPVLRIVGSAIPSPRSGDK